MAAVAVIIVYLRRAPVLYLLQGNCDLCTLRFANRTRDAQGLLIVFHKILYVLFASQENTCPLVNLGWLNVQNRFRSSCSEASSLLD